MFTDGDDSVVQRNAQKAEKKNRKDVKKSRKNQGATPQILTYQITKTQICN